MGGHAVAHCELNPIKMAWSQVKGHIKDKNRKYQQYKVLLYKSTLTEVKELVYEGFEKVTRNMAVLNKVH